MKTKTSHLDNNAFIKAKNHLNDLNLASEKIKKENSELKLEFIRNVSHEFRTPLNAIIGCYQLLKDTDLSSGEIKDIVENVTSASIRFAENGEKLLQVAMLNSGVEIDDKRCFHIDELFTSLEAKHHVAAQIKGVPLKFVNICDQKIHQDFRSLFTILSELISNAIKFTTKGSILIAAHQCSNELEFVVEDSGVGIPDNIKKEIYSPFVKDNKNFFSNNHGLGLGLFLVKKLVEKLKANVSCRTTSLGTRFNIRFYV